MKVSDFLDKQNNFETLGQKEKVRLISFFHAIEGSKENFTSGEIKLAFSNNKLTVPGNVTDVLNKLCESSPPVLVRNNGTYSFHREEFKKLEEAILGKKHVRETAGMLRTLLTKISKTEQAAFLEEAISCYEIKAYRASVVLTWILSVDVLQDYVFDKCLPQFNTSLGKATKYKGFLITKASDFAQLKEFDFIELCKTAGGITGDQKKLLEEKLGFRNTCAHPNSVVVKELKVSAFIDDLVENIILKFS